MPGIKAIDSKNLTVKNCKFSGFNIDIELKNVQGFLSENNKFSKENDPEILLRQIVKSIEKSGLDKSSQKRLYMDMVRFLSLRGASGEKEKKKIENRVLKALGDRVLDYFVQLSAAVSAGLILNLK